MRQYVETIMKPCKYCKGKYEPSPIQTMGKGCSYDCKKDIASKQVKSKPVKKKANKDSKVIKFSSFTSKPRKPLQAKTQLKTKTPLKSHSQLATKTKLKNNGMTGSAAREVKAIKKSKAEAKLAITPSQQGKPVIDIDALALAAKTMCHRYIRLRDQFEVCICCGLPLGEGYHAGHYKESGSNSAIRYNEYNISAQRSDCNIDYGGDRGDYEKNLRLKFGDGKVDWLNSVADSMVIRKYTAEDYKAITQYYKEKIQELNGDGVVSHETKQAYLRVA